MSEFYEVTFLDEPAGKVELSRSGLYCGISCRCLIPDGKMCRLVAVWTDGWCNLGIPVPDTNGFILKKQIPAKHLGEELRFVLLEASQNPEEVIRSWNGPSTEPEDMESTEENEDMGISGEIQKAETEMKEDTVPIRENEPFERLDEIIHARLEIREEGAVAVFEQKASDVQAEPDGAMVGTEDVCVDGSSDDSVPDTV